MKCTWTRQIIDKVRGKNTSSKKNLITHRKGLGKKVARLVSLTKRKENIFFRGTSIDRSISN